MLLKHGLVALLPSIFQPHSQPSGYSLQAYIAIAKAIFRAFVRPIALPHAKAKSQRVSDTLGRALSAEERELMKKQAMEERIRRIARAVRRQKPSAAVNDQMRKPAALDPMTGDSQNSLSDGTMGIPSSMSKELGARLHRHNKRSLTAHHSSQFRPLDITRREIRLVTIQPHSHDDICLILEHVDLDEADDTYDAVSYTWGPELPQRPIWINGEYMMLRENIWRFLQHLSKRGFKTKRLWIDSICINQDDTSEKSWQVSIMSEIFKNASRVYIWLGEASELSSIGTKYVYDSDSDESPWSSLYWFNREEHNGDDIVVDCMRIVFNDYWARLWVIQEVILAREALIILGSGAIELQDIMDFPGICHGYSYETEPWISYLEDHIYNQFISKRSIATNGACTLSQRVELHSDQLCHDERISRLKSLLKHTLLVCDLPQYHSGSSFAR